MDKLRGALGLCELVAGFVILVFAWILMEKVYRRIRFKEPMEVKNLLPDVRDMDAKGVAIYATVLIVTVAGIGNMILSRTMASTQIGAFYEKSEYEETYEATIYLNEKPVFCLVDMRRSVDEYDDGERTRKYDNYWIDYIYLPYGKKGYVEDSEYSPQRGGRVYLPISWEDVKIVLDRPADEESRKKLEAEVVTAYGPICGSRSGDTYHRNNCTSAKNIKMENKVFFENEKEAYMLGYGACQMCFW